MEKIFAIVLAVVQLSNAYNIGDYGVGGGVNEEYTVYRGFPLGILCSYPLPTPQDADSTPYTSCIIEKDNVVIFNRTTNSSSFRQLGLFGEADNSWQSAIINVTISGNGSETIFKVATILLEDPFSLECNNSSPHNVPNKKTVYPGNSIILECNRGDLAVKMHIPEYLKSKYTLWWYKGCQKIARDDPEYEYTNDRFGFNDIGVTKFASLKVKNASFTSEAEYSCVLENSNDVNSALYLTTTPLQVEKYVVYKGFPVGILCTRPLMVNPLGYFEDPTQYTTCIIQKNNVVIFNRTTDWDTFQKQGVFDVADDSWHMAVVTVTISEGRNKPCVKKQTIILENPKNFDCEHPSPYGNQQKESVAHGGTVKLFCQGGSGYTDPVEMQLSENLKPNYIVWWYKGCQRIERDNPQYKYMKDIYKFNELEGTEFPSLKVHNPLFTSTPGEYFCVLENSNDPNSSFHLSTTPLCMERDFQIMNHPTIKMSQKQYTVQPGSDVQIQATGNAADKPGSASMLFTWQKITSDGLQEICGNHMDVAGISTDCNATMHENKYYCEPVPPEDIANIFKEELNDNFTATLLIRDVSKEHEGTYVVSYATSNGAAKDTFVLRLSTVKHEPYKWTVALIVAGVLIVIALMLLTLLNKKRTDVRYILKKICGNYQITNKPMAFLIYSRDVGNDMPKALDTVTQFFGGRRYYDANNVAGAIEANQAGMLVHEHVVLMMGQSLSVVIFVTENLIAGNDMENFEVYQGLEENVRQALPLIFICTRAVRRKILDGEFDNVNNALRTFMSRQQSRVIIWDANNVNSFRRGLYVALPKVPHVGVEAETQISFSKSAI